MPKHRNNVKIVQWNVRSFHSNKASILNAIDKIKPDILCFQETNGKTNQNFKLTGYTCLARKERDERRGGGVAIFV